MMSPNRHQCSPVLKLKNCFLFQQVGLSVCPFPEFRIKSVTRRNIRRTNFWVFSAHFLTIYLVDRWLHDRRVCFNTPHCFTHAGCDLASCPGGGNQWQAFIQLFSDSSNVSFSLQCSGVISPSDHLMPFHKFRDQNYAT